MQRCSAITRHLFFLLSFCPTGKLGLAVSSQDFETLSRLREKESHPTTALATNRASTNSHWNSAARAGGALSPRPPAPPIGEITAPQGCTKNRGLTAGNSGGQRRTTRDVLPDPTKGQVDLFFPLRTGIRAVRLISLYQPVHDRMVETNRLPAPIRTGLTIREGGTALYPTR